MPAPRRWDPYYVSPFLGRELRRATHRSILGPDPRCEACGETRLQALIREGRRVICYECQSVEQGRSRIEQDHPLGRGERWIRYTRPLPGNRHRLVSHPDVDAFDAWADLVPEATGQDMIVAGLRIRYGVGTEGGITWDVIEPPSDGDASGDRLSGDGGHPADARPASS
jgi:hypothetical protein